MPALYALAQHDSLVAARERLHDDDMLFAFLGDLYLVSTRDLVLQAFHAVTEEVAAGAGVQTHFGKLRVWSKAGGQAPAGMEDIAPEAWVGDAVPERRGIKVLGTPLGCTAYVRSRAAKRIEDEARFLAKLRAVDDVKCAWLIFMKPPITPHGKTHLINHLGV